MPKDWVRWHERYDAPESSLRNRLEVVKRELRAALDRSPAGRIELLSMCAGQGRDVVQVLADHPRRDDVHAVLVELDPDNAEYARATSVGLPVEVIEGDASTTDAYAALERSNVLLACGIFGNIDRADVESMAIELPRLCAPRATVIWTRYPRDEDELPMIDGWFRAAGFEQVALEIGERFGVGAHRLVVDPLPFRSGVRLFTFQDDPDPERW